MNYEDLKWINQSLYSVKDKSFDSNGYLDISISISTEDELTFSQPKLVFNLDNQGQRRNVRLSISNVIDLLNSFNIVAKNTSNVFQNPQSGDITKRYNKDKDFVIEFRQIQGSGHYVMSIQIVHNTSDAGKIILPFEPDFIILGRILRMFEQDYVKIGIDLPNRYLTSLNSKRLVGIQNSIKILPSQLVPIQSEPSIDRREETPKIIEDASNPASSTDIKYTGMRCALCGEDQFDTRSGITCKNGHGGADSIDDSEQANEFEKFVAENEDKVYIPELECDAVVPKAPLAQEYNSPFITKVLKNNILNLDQMINALLTNENPLRTIMDAIHQGEGYTLLPGINEQDLKSAMYVSNIYFKLHFQSYLQNQTGFPIAIPVVKYSPNDEVDRETIELSYDLMMISAYLKLYRSKMEAINSDPYTNGALIHFSFRCFLDIATYSYLSGQNIEAVKNNVVSRFKYFREIGFFDHYDKNLESNNQKPIYDGEISEFVDKVFNNVVESDDINIRHFNAHDTGSVKLPPVNNFTLEQITNEIVKYELKTMFGQRIEELTSNEDIILLFNTKLKKKYKPTDHRPEPRKHGNYLHRYVSLKSNELPEVIRQDFLDYIEPFNRGDIYNYYNDKFKLEELPEIILQSVYVWNGFCIDDIKYTDFVVEIENCISKDLIISKIKTMTEVENNMEKFQEEDKEESNWADAIDGLEY